MFKTKSIITLLFLSLSSICSAQRFKFHKEVEFDTLFVKIGFDTEYDSSVVQTLTAQFDSSLNKFNSKRNRVFKVMHRDSHTDSSLYIWMGNIRYSTPAMSWLSTAVFVGVISLNAFVIPEGAFIPVYFIPATTSRVNFLYHENLFRKTPFYVFASDTYFMGVERQTKHFINAFPSQSFRMFMKLHRHYKEHLRHKRKLERHYSRNSSSI